MATGLYDYDRKRVIDILSERLGFERSSVKLYDRVLEKMKETGDPKVLISYDKMKEHRDQEKEHEEWLEDQIRSLGGDAQTATDLSDLVHREAQGIEAVIMKDADIAHLFHALLAAELVDNAGWDLLADLAGEAGDRELERAFKKRLHEEEEHLMFVREAVESFAVSRVLMEQSVPGGT